MLLAASVTNYRLDPSPIKTNYTDVHVVHTLNTYSGEENTKLKARSWENVKSVYNIYGP